MKIKDNYIAKRVLDNDIVIDITGATKNLIKLNETAAFMFEKLKEGISLEELTKALTNEYEVDLDTASKDVNEFVEQLKNLEILENL